VTITVELAGLEIFGHHGATEAEQELGGTLEFDVEWDVDDAAVADDLEQTVDYVQVAASVREVSESRRFRLLEALAAAVAEAVLARFPVERVRVRVRKRAITPDGLRVGFSAATVERRR
jgi:dihydroneopterin aldolase